MKKIYLLAALISISCSLFAQTPNFQNPFNNSSGAANNEVKNLTKDGSGNIYFCGKQAGELDFNGTKLSAGKGGAYFGKATSAGTIIWLNQGGCTNSSGDNAYDIAVDKNGDVYVCGSLSGFQIASFNGTTLSTMYVGFVAKYSSSGQYLWAKGYGNVIYGIAIDNNNTPVVHWEQEVHRIDPANGEIVYTPYGSIAGNNMNPHYHNIKIDAGNNIIVQAGNKIVKFDTNFNTLWSTPVTSSLAETYRISLDNSGNVYGSFYALFGTVTIGGNSKTNFPNGYMYKLDATTGNPLFVDVIQIGANASKIKDIIVDDSENYYLSGDGAFNTPHILKLDKNKAPIWDKTLSTKIKVNGIVLLGSDCLSIGGIHSGIAALDTYTLKLPAGTTTLNNSFISGLCTGITSSIEIGNNADFQIYPNPSNGVFSVVSDSKNPEIEIYNLVGKLVYHSKSQSSTTTIDLTDQQSGIYFYRITLEKQFTKSGRIIIN